MGKNMQTTLEKLTNLERKLQITIEANQVENRVKTKLREIAAKAKMPGFRPGKIPMAIINKNYAESARAEVLEKLLRETYVEAIQKEKLNPAGMPEIKITSSQPNEQFIYTATFEVYPEIKLVDLKETEVEKYIAKVADSDVDDTLEKMRKSHATWEEVSDASRKSQAGDQLIVDFTVKPLVEPAVEPKTEKGVKFVLGDGTMWKDFEQPLHDVGIDEEKQFILQMPDTHMDKVLAGRRVEFNVKIHKLFKPILPALDDEFAAKMKIKEGGIAKLKEEVHQHLERELESILKGLLKQAIVDKLLAMHPIEAPKSLVEQELKRKADEWQRRFIASNGSLENAPAFPRSDFEPQAKRSAALGLLLLELVHEHKITVAQEELVRKLKEMVSAYYDDNEEMINKLLANEQHLAHIKSLLLEDKVIEHLASELKLVEKNISYKDAISKFTR